MKNRTKLGLATMSGLVVAATAAIMLGAAATGSTVPRAFEATNAPHVTVSALPGVDLAPLARLPGSARPPARTRMSSPAPPSGPARWM